jgi:polyhydroxybutyrate depolymerase
MRQYGHQSRLLLFGRSGTMLVVLCLASVHLFQSCKNDEGGTANPPPQGYVSGKNRFTVTVDAVEREYYVHVPSGYTGSAATPVVFMLHGTSGNGEEFYNHSGWREVGEANGILTVFPSSLRYCIIDEGAQKNTTKWNTPPDADWTFCAGQTPKDDIKFLNTVIAELQLKFTVDSKRVYLVGFSNGGQMAAKCAIHMSDKLAAVVESAGSFYIDTIYVPLRKLPVTYQVGNEDYGPGNTGPAIPLSVLDTLIRTPNLPFFNGRQYRIANAHVRNFGLNPNFTISGDTNSVSVATYTSLTPNPNNSFRFVLVKGLAHAYPNGTNHPLEAAKLNWAWMKNYTLP